MNKLRTSLFNPPLSRREGALRTKALNGVRLIIGKLLVNKELKNYHKFDRRVHTTQNEADGQGARWFLNMTTWPELYCSLSISKSRRALPVAPNPQLDNQALVPQAIFCCRLSDEPTEDMALLAALLAKLLNLELDPT